MFYKEFTIYTDSIPGTFCQAVVKCVLISVNNVSDMSLLIVIMKA